jgi:hypothetical protein
MKLFKGRPWHTNTLIIFLAVWAIWSFVGLFWVLGGAPQGMFGLLDYYVLMSIPVLIGFGSYLLFIKSKYRSIPFFLLPFMYILAPVWLYPNLNLSYWQIDLAYFSQIPLAFRLSAGFFFGCAIYCLFLNKHAVKGGA